MTEGQFALLVVGVLFMGLNVFWAWHSQKLVDKLMSRNYYEYKEASLSEPKSQRKPQETWVPTDYSPVEEILN